MIRGLLDRWLAPAPDIAKVAWISRGTFAHRGRHDGDVPENSPSAFAAAIAQGLGIECDVQLSQDGQAIVFHDATLDRLTGSTGALAGRTAAQLGAIRLSPSTDTIPTLRQLLDQVGGAVPLLVEIKSTRRSSCAPLCEAVRTCLADYAGPHAIMSFDPRVSRWFAANTPATARGLVMTEEHDRGPIGRLRRHLWLWIAGPDFLAYDVRDLPSRFAASQRARGLPIATWTVRSPELRERASHYADAAIAEGAGLA